MNKIKMAVDHTMKRSYKKKPGGKGLTMKAAPWVDKELIDNIGLRSKFSREWRYARKKEKAEEIERCKRRYLHQKSITANMTQNKKSNWEVTMIAETENNPEAFWKMIKDLTGRKKEDKEEAFIFDDEGEKKEIMECRSEFMREWSTQVYQKLGKADFSFWYNKENGERQKMIEKMKEINSGIMEDPVIAEKEFVDTINKMKNNKATGVDNVPAEVMKVFIKDETVRKYLLKCFNKALTEEVHEDWLVSRTTMIPKNNKPKILEHRPIAVTVNSNKIICTILRQKIEEFLEEKGIIFDNQFGFTQGGRVEHCMFILNYVTNMTFEKRGKNGKALYLAFIDFKKAYDSIDRKKLIEVLIEYKINPKIIDLIVQMYKDDHTIINLGNMNEKIEVTGGIRQGCCISTLLFKMVTFKIIEKLRREPLFKMRKFNDNSIWLADDATLIAESPQILKQLLDCLNKAGGEYGLQINREKTKIMKIRGQEDDLRLRDYEMVEETTYLGVTIGGKGRYIFENENKKILDKANRKVNTIMSEVRKSADKAIVGKAIWKQISVPSILFGRAVIPTCNTLAEALQRKENKVWRHIMGIGGYSTVAALRGEMGASLMKTRVMETTLQFVREVMNGKFINIREMMLDTIKMKVGSWYRIVNSYLIELGIDWEDIYSMTKEDIKSMIRIYDTHIWRNNLEKKSTLKYYKEGKTKMGYEFCYRNNINSMFYARARLNSLKLEEAKGRGKPYYDKICKMCGLEEEDLLHFIIKCPTLERRRNYSILDNSLQVPEERLIQCLYKQRNYQEIGRMIKEMWYARRSILKFKEDTRRKEKSRDNDNKLMMSDPGPKRSVAIVDRGKRGISELRG